MHTIKLTVVALAIFINGYAQKCDQKAPPSDVKKMAALVGVWTGEFKDSGENYLISIKFYEENLALKAQITTTAKASGGDMADVSLCSTNKFHFFGKRLNGESFAYNANLVGEDLVGDLRIGDSCSKEGRATFKLQKKKT